MPRVKPPAQVREPQECGCGCGASFTPRQANQRFASATCRRRADRARRAAEAGEAEEAKSDTSVEHQLVKAMRAELEAAGVLATFKAQLALQLGRQLVRPEEKASTVAQLSKEVDRLMAAALGASTKPATDGDPAPVADRDEVADARAERERLIAAAAGA